MDNLVDLFQAVDVSNMDDDIKVFVKKMIAIEFEEKPLAALDRAVDESLGLVD